MLIKLIHSAGGFMLPAEFSVKLPTTGITVITGDNGHGKSRLIEAVAYAHWGKTLRGATPWREGETGHLTVTTANHHISQRVTKKGGKKLAWRAAGEDGFRSYDRQSTTKNALGDEVPTMALWRRTHVFSSADAAHFSSATDKERKQLIEAVVGIQAFDIALDKLRADLRLKEAAEGNLSLAAAHASTAYSQLKAQLAEWFSLPPFERHELAGDAPPNPDPKRELELLDSKEEQEELLAQPLPPNTLSQATADHLQATTVNGQDAQDVYRLRREGKCGECERPFKTTSIEQAQAAATAAIAIHEEARRGAAAELEAVTKVWQEAADKQAVAQGTLRGIRAELQSIAIAKSAHERWVAQVAQHEDLEATRAANHAEEVEKRTQAKHALSARARAAASTLLDAEDEHGDALADLAELQAVEKILGIRGPRVQVLSQALAGIEAVANGWMERMLPGTTLGLKPYAELKSKGSKGTARYNDQLGLTITGTGGVDGYKSLSGGQRRRVDAALILGLAEVASAAQGEKHDGTLWMDEVFDALDVPGCEAVAECLNELGLFRPIVVITHRPELVRMIQATQRLRAENGTFSVF